MVSFLRMIKPNEDDVYAPLRSLDTGDILLYRTKDLGATFNAVMQGSYYSHVSMVVRDDPAKLKELFPDDYKEDSELAILEVVPSRGVTLFPLESRLARTITNVQHVSVRRHCGIIPDASMDNLYSFIQQVLGRQLEIMTLDMARSLFRNRLPKWLRARGNPQENWNKFYCSELVAEALQQLFIIREEALNSNDLIPASFAAPKDLSHHKSFNFDERITMPGHSYGEDELLIVPGNALCKELKTRKRRMKQAYKKQLRQQQKLRGKGGRYCALSCSRTNTRGAEWSMENGQVSKTSTMSVVDE